MSVQSLTGATGVRRLHRTYRLEVSECHSFLASARAHLNDREPTIVIPRFHQSAVVRCSRNLITIALRQIMPDPFPAPRTSALELNAGGSGSTQKPAPHWFISVQAPTWAIGVPRFHQTSCLKVTERAAIWGSAPAHVRESVPTRFIRRFHQFTVATCWRNSATMALQPVLSRLRLNPPRAARDMGPVSDRRKLLCHRSIPAWDLSGHRSEG
jgi:hypothetical protein